MIRKTAVTLIFVTVLWGCATTKREMPEDTYKHFSAVYIGTEKCLAEGHLSPKLYGDAKDAFRTLLGTWTFDTTKLTNTVNDMSNGVLRQTPTAQDCRRVEGSVYGMITEANRHAKNTQENKKELTEAVNQFNNSFRKPIYCNTIGTMTMCN